MFVRVCVTRYLEWICRVRGTQQRRDSKSPVELLALRVVRYQFAGEFLSRSTLRPMHVFCSASVLPPFHLKRLIKLQLCSDDEKLFNMLIKESGVEFEIKNRLGIKI